MLARLSKDDYKDMISNFIATYERDVGPLGITLVEEVNLVARDGDIVVVVVGVGESRLS